ncbi:MAG: hypothetical protein PUD65_06605 [Spirochaetales bacterium]|nr:hypothetical protein [Spirochaetales bacterium]
MHFKKTKILILALLLLFAPSLGAKGNGSYIYPLSSPIYSWLEEAYLLEGLGHPSSSKPWSGSEVDNILSLLEGRAVEERTAELMEKARKENGSHSSEGGDISFSLSVSPEFYAHSNEEEYNLESSWIHGFDYRNPFLMGEMDISFFDRFHLYSNLSLGWGRTTYKDEWIKLKDMESFIGVGAIVDKDDDKASVVTSSYLYSKPFLFSFPHIDKLNIETPTRNYLSTGGEGWFLTLSKDKLQWNKSHIGSFIFDSHLEYQEYLRFKLFRDKLSFEYVMEFFDTDTSNNVMSTGSGIYRLFSAHAISYRPVPSLLFTLSEDIMYVSDSVDPHYLNPSTLYHNLNNSTLLNAIAHVAFSFSPMKGVNTYGQFVLDQATAPTEASTQAAAWGISLGIEGVFKAGKGTIEYNAEGAYTTPELYRRQKADFLLFQRYSTNINYKRFLFFDYFGFPYGGDSVVMEGEIKYISHDGWNTGIKGEYLLHGEMGFYTSHSSSNDNTKIPDIKDSTPYKSANVRYTLSLFGEWRIEDIHYFKEIEIRGALDWTKGNEDEGDLQFTAGISLKI